MADLEFRLQDYAYKLISVAVKQEYENQIDTWASHIETLVAYAKVALKQHQQVLVDIRSAMAAQQAQQELAMVAFSFMGGMALSWVSGAIQYKMIPKLLGKTKVASSVAIMEEIPGVYRYIPVYDKTAHDRTIAKVFGDFGSKLSEKLVLSPLLKVEAPDMKGLENSIHRIADSMTLELFEANIKNALREARKLGGTAIANYAGTIQADREFGKRWVKAATERQKEATAKYVQRPVANFNTPSDLQTYGEAMIREAVDAQRRQWANDWFYFGNDPVALHEPFVINALEVEIWRLWILTEKFERYEYSLFRDDATEQDEYRVKGRSGIDIDEILTRLVNLGVFAGRYPRELKQWMDRWNDHHRELGLLPVEVGTIDGVVDTDEERLAVLNWARNRKPMFLGDQRQAVARPIEPIDPSRIPMH